MRAEVADETAGHVYELSNNARSEHAWLCAQVYRRQQRSRIELVVADAGRGIRESLAGTVFEEPTDSSAIITAAQRRTTSVGRPNHSGIGLASLIAYVSANRGTTHIRSGGSIVEFGTMTQARHTVELSGTIVSCSIHL